MNFIYNNKFDTYWDVRTNTETSFWQSHLN